MTISTDIPSGPDLAKGLALDELADGTMLQGHVAGEAVLVARRGDKVFAVGAHCTHYGAPLVDGILVGETVRCPWHHACFGLADGDALRPPALAPVDCWQVELRDERAFVTHKAPPPAPRTPPNAAIEKIVIVGAGAAGNAAAEMLRREGYSGSLTVIGAEATLPSDRPNLSKDFLAGTAGEEMIPLRTAEFYFDEKITFVTDARVTAIDVPHKTVEVDGGGAHPYDRLLLATGAEPIRLDIEGSDLPHVHTVRTPADSHAIIALATDAPGRRAVVIGASFIGLEVAASLRARDLEVHVVAPEDVPLQRVLGQRVGEFIRGLHEAHGVIFHLGLGAVKIAPDEVTLSDGTRLAADVVVMGVGVRPSVALAADAGLSLDRGVVVDEFLETSEPGIFAAGDIARYPDPYSGARLRIEHWVSAERQGQTAARNLLGRREPYRAVPFFWSAHYDVTISYVGHAERWDRIEITGSLEARDCRIEYVSGDRVAAVATIGRDRESLEAEARMERERP